MGIFTKKSGSVTHNHIWAPNTMLSSKKKTNEPIPGARGPIKPSGKFILWQPINYEILECRIFYFLLFYINFHIFTTFRTSFNIYLKSRFLSQVLLLKQIHPNLSKSAKCDKSFLLTFPKYWKSQCLNKCSFE